MTQQEKKRLFKIYVKSLKNTIRSVDHVIGSDELYDINYWIQEIEKIVLDKKNN